MGDGVDGRRRRGCFSSCSHLTRHVVIVGYLTETNCLSGCHDLERLGHSNLKNLELAPSYIENNRVEQTITGVT